MNKNINIKTLKAYNKKYIELSWAEKIIDN